MHYVLGGLKTRKNDWKRKYEGRNHKKKFNNWLWYLTVLSYYVLGGLKTQKILTWKKIWICEYVRKEHKKGIQ